MAGRHALKMVHTPLAVDYKVAQPSNHLGSTAGQVMVQERTDRHAACAVEASSAASCQGSLVETVALAFLAFAEKEA